MIHGLYTVALTGVIAAYAPFAIGRRLTSGVPLNLRARFGYDARPPSSRPAGWIHAVSVGEAITAAPLVIGLRQRYPELPLVVTTVTETGACVVRERLGTVAEHRYFPLDLPGAVRRVVDAIDPAFLVCMETELWPNVLRLLHRRGVPVMIANGRLSDRSFRRYALVRPVMGPMLGPVRVLAMRSEEDARRIVALGARPERVVVTGNMKHDAVPSSAELVDGWRRRLGLVGAQRVWVAGSTHRGEEEAVLEAHVAARGDHHDLVLVIAPRHPERATEVQVLVEARGLRAVRRSRLPAVEDAGAVVILDTVGELAELYGVADAVFVGGSLVAAGGHNMLEPARLHKVVLFGPHTSNFREAAAALASGGGGFVVKNAAELGERLRHLLANHADRQRAGEAAHAVVVSRQGAVERTLDLLSPLVDARADDLDPTVKRAFVTSRISMRWVTAWEGGPRPAPRPFLATLSGAYRGVVTARAWLYQAGVLRSRAVGCPVVSIGNITVGGTGKTPAVELAVQTLTRLGYRPAVVSRGYRRRSRGAQIVADAASIRLEPEDAGDEPFLLARRLPGIPVVVGANRAEAVQLARDRFGITAVVLDDGFQHRTVVKDLEIVMARARNPWGNGRLLPSGPLREPLGALARADLVVAAGALSLEEAPEVVDTVRRYAPGCPVLAARYVPVECWEAQRVRPVPLEQLAGARLVAFAGIASPLGFQATLDEIGVHVEAAIAFRDHHWYTERDLAALEAQAAEPGRDGLVTTEKDWVRLRALRPCRRPLYVVSVRLDLFSGHAEWLHAFEQACPKR